MAEIISIYGNRQVSLMDGEELSKQLAVPLVETSALNGSNVEAAFVTMTSNIKKRVDKRGLSGQCQCQACSI